MADKIYTKVVVNGQTMVQVDEQVTQRVLTTSDEINRKIAQLQTALTQLQAEKTAIDAELAK